MILRSLRLRYFRNFEDRVFHFESGKNVIIGDNGVGKTNILEALALPQSHLVESNPLYHLKKGSETSGIEFHFDIAHLLYTYGQSENKKKYFSEKKAVSKKKFQSEYPHIISFHPQMMDLLYGSPSARRNFLDEMLCQAFPQYITHMQQYKKVLLSRNRILARICEGKSDASELHFWDIQYLELTETIYAYRDRVTHFFQEHISELNKYFFGKVELLEFHSLSKTPQAERGVYLKKYIQEQHEKEVYQRKTLRGPHLDDFSITVDSLPIEHYASRGEIKSILLGLKFLGGDFIETHSDKKNILFLVDDILSELDSIHMDMIYAYIGNRQCIITSIRDIGETDANKIYL